METSKQTNSQNDFVNRKLNLIQSPISINGDNDFKNIASTYNWKGNGTSENPYIIENLTIQTNTNLAISIGETTVYFIIRNCIVSSQTSDGIALSNVKNGLLINNTSGNNAAQGIDISYSSNINLTNNKINNNKGNGIYIGESNKILIDNNSVANNSLSGIQLVSNSIHDIIVNNSFDSNFASGIYIGDKSNNNGIFGNIIQGSVDGITAVITRSNLISNNTFQNNIGYGVDLQSPYDMSNAKINSSTMYNTVIFNNFYNNNIDTGIQAYCDDSSNKFQQNFWSNDLIGNNYKIDGNVATDSNSTTAPTSSVTTSTTSSTTSSTLQSNPDNKNTTLVPSSNSGKKFSSNLLLIFLSFVLVVSFISSLYIYYQQPKQIYNKKTNLFPVKKKSKDVNEIKKMVPDKKASILRCQKCGGIVLKEDIFCFNCGNKLK